MGKSFQITANRVDVVARRIAPETVTVKNGIVASVQPATHASGYLIPGFVDAHVHIESSMVMPSEFARAAVVHGTVATVSDPHEIANVCGLEGVERMLQDAEQTPFKFHFGAPSCVPTTKFETAGARISVREIGALLDNSRINHLSEVMNFPGVIAGDAEVMAKLAEAQKRGLPIDGHAPGVRGNEAERYIRAGISTDHECVSAAEAEEKIKAGCKIMIREGSAARNFEALWPLIGSHTDMCMLCSDDKHPDALLVGHINELVVRALKKGCDLFDVLRCASVNPIEHYALDVGLLQPGDPADFLLVDDIRTFRIRETYIDGQLVAKGGRSTLSPRRSEPINYFVSRTLSADSVRLRAETDQIRVIDVNDGQLITGSVIEPARIRGEFAESDVSRDLLKLVVVNRYRDATPAIGYVRGFGLQHGALASSVAHDSHNVVAVGVSDDDILTVINQVMDSKGGLAACGSGQSEFLHLPVAGLMSNRTCEAVAADYLRLEERAKQQGCALRSPFMTLSFLALPVIPSLKLTDRGLFDVDRFDFVSVFS